MPRQSVQQRQLRPTSGPITSTTFVETQQDVIRGRHFRWHLSRRQSCEALLVVRAHCACALQDVAVVDISAGIAVDDMFVKDFSWCSDVWDLFNFLVNFRALMACVDGLLK